MKKKIFTLLTLALLSISAAWGADPTIYAISSFTQKGNVYEYTFSEAKLKNLVVWVEVPSATSAGTVTWQGSNKADGRYMYIYGNNGTVKDETRKLSMLKNTYDTAVNFSKNDILTNDDGKYYLVFSTSDDYKAAGVKYTIAETYTVTYKAGEGTGDDVVDASAATVAGYPDTFVLPSGKAFKNWNTAADGTGTSYEIGADVTSALTLYAQYVGNVAPEIAIDNYTPSTKRGQSLTFTATASGSPAPTVTWYQSETASTSGGTEKGTGSTYSPNVTSEGTFYFYAVASNGFGADATSSLITLTVVNPDKVVSGNSYSVEVGEEVVGGQKIVCDDITMEFVSTGAFDEGKDDKSVNALVTDFVAQVSGKQNAWAAKFTPAKSGSLEVGVIINGGKEFSITNVVGFDYKTTSSTGTISSNSWKPSDKIYGVVTIDVVAGQEYSFSVAGSKLGFYGFKFTPITEVAITPANEKSTYVTTQALDFTGVDGLKAYVATAANASGVTIEEVTAAVPAGTPLLLIGTAGATYDVPVAATASAPAKNLLMAGDGTTKFSGSTYDYILFSDGLFYQIGSGTVATNKAYLHLDAAPSGARALNIIVGDATAVKAVQTVPTDGACYNLSGQRVAQPSKGLYIVNGKKYIVK